MGECQRCGHCCTYAQISYSNNDHGKSQAKWFQLHGCRVIEREEDIRIFIPVTCAWLAQDRDTKKYFCANYERRPDICRKYQCEASKGG